MTTICATDTDGRQVELDASNSATVMEVLRDEGLNVEAICGGQCACATCHCIVVEDWVATVGQPGDTERSLLETLEHYVPGQSRLSCQIPIAESLNGLQITVAPDE